LQLGIEPILKRVLLVDDQDDTRELVALVLVRAGYSVLQAANGRQALDLLVATGCELPSLILLDLQMPVMSGWEFLTIVRSYARLAVIPVIVVSGGHKPTQEIRDQTAGFFAKPVDHRVLLERVREIVAA
jgi:CheY-like chemotaxis protein